MGIRITEMTIGEIIGEALTTSLPRFPLFAFLLMTINAPLLAVQLNMPDIAVDRKYQVLFKLIPLAILGPIGTAALLRVITRDLLERPVSVSDSLFFALRHFGSLFVTTLLAGLGMLLGFLLCVIPGIYLAIIWSLISQVVIMENLSGSSALSRSKELVSGSFGRVFGLLIVVGLLAGGLNSLIVFGLNMAFPHLEHIPEFIGQIPVMNFRVNNYLNFVIVTIATLVVTAGVQSFHATCMTLLYFDLRNRKEAFNIGQIAAWSDQSRSWRDEPDAPFDAPPTDPTAQGSIGIESAERPPPRPITDFSENKASTPPQ